MIIVNCVTITLNPNNAVCFVCSRIVIYCWAISGGKQPSELLLIGRISFWRATKTTLVLTTKNGRGVLSHIRDVTWMLMDVMSVTVRTRTKFRTIKKPGESPICRV